MRRQSSTTPSRRVLDERRARGSSATSGRCRPRRRASREATGRAEAFAAWRRFFEALAERSPLVLVFEDLQWADDGMLDFVDHLVDWATRRAAPRRRARRVRSCSRAGPAGAAARRTRRPSRSRRCPTTRPRVLMGGSWTEPSSPRRRSDAARARRRQSALRRGVRADARRKRRLGRARAARDGPGDHRGAARRALRRGEGAAPGRGRDRQGVLGRRAGSVRAAGAVRGRAASARTRAREFVRRERRASVAGESEYAFVHLLVRDVAYGQIPRARERTSTGARRSGSRPCRAGSLGRSCRAPRASLLERDHLCDGRWPRHVGAR